jgi:hypothetical protein
MRLSLLSVAASLAVAGSLRAQQAPNACGLVPSEDVKRLIYRANETFNAQPEALVVGRGKGSLCFYPGESTVAIYPGPNSAAVFEDELRGHGIQPGPRQTISGIGDKAYLFYPKQVKEDTNLGPYLVTTVGPYTVTAFLVARKGQADGPMATYCRDSANVKKNDKKSCRQIMADKSEVPESLQPAAEELGRILVAKVRAGKF